MSFSRILPAFLVTVLLSPAHATLPGTISYQSYLTDPSGSPITNPTLSVTFSMYTAPAGGAPVWSETQLISVDQGLLSVELGAAIPFPAGTFDVPIWLGIAVDADPEMTPRRALTSVAAAFEAANSEALQGKTAADLDQSLHVSNTGNPHSVTAEQTGAAADLASHAGDSDAHHSRYTNTEAVNAILAADGTGSGLDADTVDGVDSSAFINTGTDFGRFGVSPTLYEGVLSLTTRYVNEGQSNSVTSSMILDGSVNDADLDLPLTGGGSDLNGGLITMINTAPGSSGNLPAGLLGQATGDPGSFSTFGVAGLSPGLGLGSPAFELPGGNRYGVVGGVNTGIGTAGISRGGSGVGVYGDGTAIGVKAIGINGPTKGYLGVQGATDFDGELALDISGFEIGVLGYSSGGSANDNYALYGVSNGVGIYAQGITLAGEFVGDIQADSLRYTQPRMHYYSVGDGDFKSALGNAFSTSFSTGGAYMSVAGTQVMVAGLHLPQGATITRFTAYVDDNAAGDLSIRLSRLTHGGNGFTTVASVASSGAPGLANYTDQTIAEPVVDNATYSYHVRVFSSNWPGNSTLKIKGAVVEYTVSEAQ